MLESHDDTLPRVLAVVVAFRAVRELERCLRALADDECVTRIIVVDNSSCCDIEAVGRTLPLEVEYVRPGANLGFGLACNIGAARRGNETHLLLVNPDVILSRSIGCLFPPLAHAALSSGLMVDEQGRADGNVRQIASITRELRRAAFGATALARRDAKLRDRSGRVPQVAGSLMLMTFETWAALGGFDPQFELYFDDVDLCRRAIPFGGAWFTADMMGVHCGGSSFRSNRSAGFIAAGVSRVRYLRHWYGRLGAASAGVAAIVEFVSRSITMQSEGASARRDALVAQFRELRRPGSIWVLSDANTRAAATAGLPPW